MALLAGVGVGVCSSVIPYVTDQLAMARLSRATYSLMVALLPAIAVVVGVVVLGQLPSTVEMVAVALVIAGVAVHRDPGERDETSRTKPAAERGQGPSQAATRSEPRGSPAPARGPARPRPRRGRRLLRARP